MQRIIIYIAFFCVFFSVEMTAQISPGDLAQPHAELEGIFNCTKCHELGNKVVNSKCLDCHEDISKLIDKRQGYHASKEVKNKDCTSCHSDHHGRKFKLIRFDEDEFDHNLADYELVGEHKKIECRDCHKSDFIKNPDIRKRKKTFLGLDQECLACHDDYHQQELDNDCAQCHTIEAFSPADKFDHNDTDYRLRGKHKDVDCEDCHKKETKNGRDFQHFTDIPFDNCTDCHDDPHKNNLGTGCTTCHSESSFTSMKKARKFNHKKTGFPLKGQHKRIDCKKCHDLNVTPTKLFQDNLNVRTNECATCHDDVHENKFGSNCAQCHVEKSFHELSDMADFNHNLTDYTLVGKHQTVDCRKCHSTTYTDPLPHSDCISCHTDYHENEFTQNGIRRDCAECHTETGFEPSLYTLDDHQKTKFPLEGAHFATPCFECHLKNEKWTFRAIGKNCVDCHDNLHQGFLDEKYYPEQNCKNCHVSDSWKDNHFDHNQTDFELKGAHKETDCMQCHRTDDDKTNKEKYWNFAGLPKTCNNCHENKHGKQFEINGITDCARCHGNESWNADNFNHDNTAFKLEGKHAEIDCKDCHKLNDKEEGGEKIIQYKFKSFECVVCHK